MSRPTASNQAFARTFEQSGMSRKGLARRVRDLAASKGQTSSADHVAVKRWLDGTQPRAETAHLIAAALSEKLGRAVTLAALGFTAGSGEMNAETASLDRPVRYPLDANEASHTLADLASSDLDGPASATLQAWDTDAASHVVSGYLFGHHGVGEPEPPTEAARPLDANAIRQTTAHLMSLDFQLGGGHTRKLLLFYFRDQVLPLFNALPESPRRGDLFLATAELAQMLGWSAYDAGRHGAAQRYFIYGLRLAREAGDDLLGARLLSNLSHQANYLGHFQNAVELARGAQSAAARSTSATTMAMLQSMEARALASLGDLRGCAAALHRAEISFDRSDPTADPDWIRYFNAAELAGEAAHCFRDLRQPDETNRFATLAVAPADTPARTRAFINMVTATGALQAGSLDEAISMTRRAVELAGPLQSSRYQRYVRDFVRSAVDLHPRDVRVADLVAFTSPLLGATSR
jgi:tetratricopeptide (TPR) repeat protein